MKIQKIFAKHALLASGWNEDVIISVKEGEIIDIVSGQACSQTDYRYDVVLAGMPSVHSHAFQRAMAGYSERRLSPVDSFWSWRREMYRLALSLTPDQVRIIASQLYMELLEAGFTHIGEFHYLHHHIDGSVYEDVAEMAAQIVEAAAITNINLTLLPVFYAHSNFGGQPPAAGQVRFISDLDLYEKLLDKSRYHIAKLSNASLGVAPHSLRAVTPEELNYILNIAGDMPIHMHIAEQVKEVEDCQLWSAGKRPVEWLLDNYQISDNWCLIHATHMNDSEAAGVAASGATVALCPLTEGSLGDGIFNIKPYLANNGSLAIGTDSNVYISVREELRQLEYALRLGNRERNIVATLNRSNGRTLFDKTLAGGERALKCAAAIAVGNSLNLVALDMQGQDWIKNDYIIDNWLFVGNLKVDAVWADGKLVVEAGVHKARHLIEPAFKALMMDLFSGEEYIKAMH